MQKNKYVLKIVILVMLCSLVSGCVLSPQVELDNFLIDLDVECRFEEIAFDIEFGRWSEYFQKNITVLIDDLETFETDNSESQNIIDDFIQSANLFLLASEYYYDGKTEIADESYNTAKDLYDNARRKYHYFVNYIS